MAEVRDRTALDDMDEMDSVDEPEIGEISDTHLIVAQVVDK